MGTSKGNIGRKMYSIIEYREKISRSLTLKRKTVYKKCKVCDTLFRVERIIDKNDKERISKKERKCCSIKCAATKKHTDYTKNKLSKIFNKQIKKKCSNCKKIFFSTKSSNRKYCSRKCYNIKQRKISDIYAEYRKQCYFKFDLKKYPDEFNFSLLIKYGWYHSVKNPKGVSRDHKISIKYGFDNKISPTIISHPANCELIKHIDNKLKGTHNSIKLNVLLKKIDNWNNKYGLIAPMVEQSLCTGKVVSSNLTKSTTYVF